MTDPDRPKLSGDERFDGLSASVKDFWSYALSDLRANAVRGYLAEFLVARAVNATGPRVEWDAYDVLAPDGTTIEVKATGHSQSWERMGPPLLTFSGLLGGPNKRSWYASSNSYGPAHVADVFVFAVHTTPQDAPYDPLDIAAWQFHVLGGATVERAGQRSMRLSTVVKLGGTPVAWSALASEIDSAKIVSA